MLKVLEIDESDEELVRSVADKSELDDVDKGI